MIETSPTISQLSPQLRASMGQAVICLTRQAASKETKRALAAKGLKPQYIARREIVTMARSIWQSTLRGGVQAVHSHN
jgi:hypothetical protein